MRQTFIALWPVMALLAACGSDRDEADFCGASPALSVPEALLDAALQCDDTEAAAGAAPVLLVPGTTLTPEVNFDWNYLPALAAEGIPACTVALPDAAMGDIQIAAEYVTHAIRTLHAASGQRIRIVGYSQGGMVPRWSLKYWPETRDMVSDLISLAGSHNGTLTAIPICLAGCAEAIHQQTVGSRFLAALNDGPQTFDGIAYTAIYTWFDEVVTPNLPPNPASALTPADNVANIALQEVCPLNVSEHVAIGTYDNTAWRLVLDALRHDGPADPSRLDPVDCLQLLMPGVDPLRAALDIAATGAFIAQTIVTTPMVADEPPLACYADNGT